MSPGSCAAYPAEVPGQRQRRSEPPADPGRSVISENLDIVSLVSLPSPNSGRGAGGEGKLESIWGWST